VVQKQQIPAVATLSDDAAREAVDFRNAAGALWCSGVAIDPARFDRRERRRRLLLPTYPFERQRYWVEAEPAIPARRRVMP
jgi:acyl transferase domain-containing protein